MKNLCTYCDRRFGLYADFRKHLQTSKKSKKSKKSNTIITDTIMEELDKNIRNLLLMINHSAMNI